MRVRNPTPLTGSTPVNSLDPGTMLRTASGYLVKLFPYHYLGPGLALGNYCHHLVTARSPRCVRVKKHGAPLPEIAPLWTAECGPICDGLRSAPASMCGEVSVPTVGAHEKGFPAVLAKAGGGPALQCPPGAGVVLCVGREGLSQNRRSQ